ncbi:MAG: radical SAM protein, partial [Hadesarchaea archaeon]|nr:radical SAM protein [Hadesarchaea archaeon]
MSEKLLKKTKSLCPECMKVIEAEVVEEDGKALIKKECPEHGKFQDIYWSDAELYKRFQKFAEVGDGIQNPRTKEQRGCPFDCGICPNHKSHTVLSIIDVTNRCNLKCPICFANAAAAGYVYEPTFEQIRGMLKNLRNNKPTPPPAIQFSGGEPTLRDDLPDIVRAAKEAGFWHVEVNTNGVRFAKDLDFIKRLREAGVSTIYLQFDGMTPEPTIKARGADILQLKFKALENCRKAGLTSIVLVVTLVKWVNDDQLGDIIR